MTDQVRPAVSVVVIVYNDQDRLPGAIESARQQTLENIEIIVVDHGSTDGSLAVAKSAAAQDPRIRVIALGDNEGKPGRPINAGISAARAPWVTVFGSDDILRPRACERMLRVATKYDADLVVGSLRRVNKDTGEMTRWMPDVTRRSRVVTDIAQFPELIRDTVGGGKLYSTDFIRRAGMSFPEDIYYQDQVFTFEYFATASRIAITSQYVLNWRHWPSSSRQSVTQRRSSVENLRDRFRANRLIEEVLRKHGREDLSLLQQRKFLTHDLNIHVKDLAETTGEYRELLVKAVQQYVATFRDEAFQGIRLSKWLMVQALMAGRPLDAERVGSSFYGQMLTEWDRFQVDGREYLVPEWFDDPEDRLFDVTRYRIQRIPARFQPTRARVVVSASDRRARLIFTISIVGRDAGGEKGEAELLAHDPESGKRLLTPLKRVKGVPGSQVWRGKITPWQLDLAFGFSSGPVELLAVFHRGQPGQWSVKLRPDPDHDDAQTGPARWRVKSEEQTVVLLRGPKAGNRDSVAQFMRRGEQFRPESLEEFTLDQAREYLSDERWRARSDTAFFESFAGRRVADGPLAVSRALCARSPRTRQFWSCSSAARLDVPDFATGVLRYSRGYLDALAEASVWVDNGWLPFDPDGRRLVQLWHGVPMAKLKSPEQAVSWTHLVSSGNYFDDCMRGAFGGGPEILPVGAPRTDFLLGDSARKRREALRTTWGLADRKIIFFCPSLRTGEVSTLYRRPELHRIAAALGPDYFWFHREHDDDVAGRRSGGPPEDLRWFMAKVNMRLELSDYLLMADIFVSDYSSFIVDFGLTGREVIHYAPDREFFEDVNPTTYFHLSDLAAGPIVENDDDLIECVKSLAAASGNGISRAFADGLAPLDAQVSADALLSRLGWR